MITAREYDVLQHASQNGRYVTGDPFVLEMAKRGLLFDHGAQRLAAGDHYLVTTARGRAAIVEYRASLPPPKPVKKRRKSAAFESWQRWLDANGRCGFAEFLKDVWPRRAEWS